MSEDVIVLENVWKIFGERAQEAMQAVQSEGLTKPEVLEKFACVVGIADCSFSVQRGEIFCVMGLSGSGKSTMVRHLNRLIEPTYGNISVLGKDMLSLSGDELREMRAMHIGMVFQHMALLPHRTVRDNVGFPLQIRGEPKSKRWAVSQQCLSRVNLDGYEDRFPKELSGGMQQRVGLARALASDPEVLLMDEPFSALDPLIRRQLQDQFMALSAELNKTTVFITHDLDEAIRIGNRIAIMKDGLIVQIGTPEDIVTKPADDYVKDFVEGISKLKLVFAHSIMEDINAYKAGEGENLRESRRVPHDTDLDHLIDVATESNQPIVVQNDDGEDVGVINKSTLLKGIQGGKA
ncbi:MAG: betaine/proline/choline family ABC transporter ATP-binding protein [Pseudomonadota bacterium]